LLEEIFNSITHGVAFLAILIGLIFFFVFHHHTLSITAIVGFSIFGASLLFLYIISTLYHSLYFTKAKKVFSILDYAAIYLLIAGTYTPILLSVVRDSTGLVLLSLVWIVAIAGIVIKSVVKEKYPVISTGTYLFMGWMILVVLKPLFHAVALETFLLILFGGLFYSFGVIFYALKKMPFNHTIWHLFVIGGSVCHVFAVYAVLRG
jgi:hemolysin III